jgi:hypothetical protein
MLSLHEITKYKWNNVMRLWILDRGLNIFRQIRMNFKLLLTYIEKLEKCNSGYLRYQGQALY